MSRANSPVPQETFSQEIIHEAARVPYNPVEHNGKLNPYTGRKITNEQEYYEYQREYVYHRLCDEILRIQYEQKLASQIQRYTSIHEADLRTHKIFSRVRFLALLFALIFVLFRYLPNQKTIAFQEGQSNGYSSGYAYGFENGTNATASLAINNSSKSTRPKDGISMECTVYVSQSGHKIHLQSNCSGMQYYDTMTYIEALTAGYHHCSKCF